MNKEEQQAFEAGKKAIKRLLIEEKRMKAKLERIQKDKLAKQFKDSFYIRYFAKQIRDIDREIKCL